jgi:glycosyltransferase involved in cell wall biosynthesis
VELRSIRSTRTPPHVGLVVLELYRQEGDRSVAFPVSVVIPTIPQRERFLLERCLPSVHDNEPSEVVVVREQGNGSKKRNLGFSRTSHPYILFVDDDSILRASCIRKMLAKLEGAPGLTFVYCDYERFITPGAGCDAPGGYFSAGPFNLRRLRTGNYINTTSLIRREACASWDERLERFQDWDFWLSVTLAGGVGGYIPEALYELWQIDASVSSTVQANPYIEMIVAKHKLSV